MPLPTSLKKVHASLRQQALSYPETKEDFPWGHSAFKVKGKAFLFMADDKNELSLSVKLPSSGSVALDLPFAEPTGYGLGKSGWVTARFAAKAKAPLWILQQWLEESYCAVAPKKLGAIVQGDAGGAGRKVGLSQGARNKTR